MPLLFWQTMTSPSGMFVPPQFFLIFFLISAIQLGMVDAGIGCDIGFRRKSVRMCTAFPNPCCLLKDIRHDALRACSPKQIEKVNPCSGRDRYRCQSGTCSNDLTTTSTRDRPYPSLIFVARDSCRYFLTRRCTNHLSRRNYSPKVILIGRKSPNSG
jgi:hypothetical protein